MKRVGKIHPVPKCIDSTENLLSAFMADVGQAKQMLESQGDFSGLKTEDTAQNPFAFKHDGFTEPDVMGLEQGDGTFMLSGIVIDQKTDDDVSIDREHGVP